MLITSRIAFLFLLVFSSLISSAQTITGVWRGKINRQNAELKLVKTGDDLVGVAYYYSSKNKFKRYSVKGHFDPETNAVVLWDEILLAEQQPRQLLQIGPDPEAQMMVADFNCPGSDEMYLDGNSSARDNKSKQNGLLHLEKMPSPMFPDEWDYIINNYFVGTNDPELIDSISQFGIRAKIPEEKAITAAGTPSINATPVAAPTVNAPNIPVSTLSAKNNNDKFSSRKNVLQTVIPITAEVIELRFYDNAQVDGDSIALFLNGNVIFEHIRLTEQPYTIKLTAGDLSADNELVMVAENLGSIPPNTSFMVAIVGDKRYEARLFANEQSSALIRIVRQVKKAGDLPDR